eukprot:333900-Chlamydomonas_euryale.AAC.1
MPATRARWCMRRCLRPGHAGACGDACDPGALAHAAMPATRARKCEWQSLRTWRAGACGDACDPGAL